MLMKREYRESVISVNEGRIVGMRIRDKIRKREPNTR